MPETSLKTDKATVILELGREGISLLKQAHGKTIALSLPVKGSR
jgi:hypothetical protein